MGKGRLEDMIARAEEAVVKKAAQYAYQCTNNITEGTAQTAAYTMIKESIILGARLMQEELKKDNEKNHEYLPPGTKVRLQKHGTLRDSLS